LKLHRANEQFLHKQIDDKQGSQFTVYISRS
jgi:hypothetical protein